MAKSTKAKDEAPSAIVVIEPPKFQRAVIRIVGTSPYVQNKFSQKAREQMEAKQRAGSQATKGRKREPKDFDAVYEGALHVSREGWYGIPAPAFRNAMISACRVVGFRMTLAKLSVFIEADGFDRDDGTPLVKIEGAPRPFHMTARNETGVADVRVRPIWDDWSANVRVRWDADQFSATDIMNLLARAGMQVGVGEGRPDSRNSNGLGWGLWEVAG
ncbi:MAG TPA: hypothetical protein VFA12_20165 [Stellaceae bacterium]|nr:hypothetical protein [Stellaceae bacterium]